MKLHESDIEHVHALYARLYILPIDEQDVRERDPR